MTVRSVALLAALCAAGVVRAQQPDMAGRVAALKANIAANQQALHKYQWLQTTKISVKGEVKQTQISSCAYQAGQAKPVCTEMSSTPAEKPSGGPLKRKIIEDKIAQMKAMMDSVKTLIAMDVPPEPARIEAARAAGNIAIAPDPASGAVRLVITNYAQKGDAYTLIVGDSSKMLRSATIATWLNDPTRAVTLRVTFDKLGDGTRYASSKILDVSADEIQVAVTATNYTIAAGN
jgi:hypothetical protein